MSVKSLSYVVDLTNSPHARLKPVPLPAVCLTDTFWQPRREINRTRTLKSQFEHLKSTNRLENFHRVARGETGGFEGIYFNDSDVYKWLEAAASSLAQDDDLAVRAMVGEVIKAIVAAQLPDGFLHTYFTLNPEKERWGNLKDQHQLYCMGHFIQAAVAHYRATGEEVLLEVALRLFGCIEAEFGWGKREETDGHEEIELALIELARTTGQARILDLAKFFLDIRGKGTIGGGAYHQDHVPLRELKEVTGHAVRALYYASGAADLFLETGEAAVREALDAQWECFTERRMYVTGGAGARWEGEAFGEDYELPNARAYAETCAAIAAVMWAWRMGQIEGEAKYFDVMERALYNGVLSGLSLDGEEYFYQNPLLDFGKHRRQKWFGCACCPPNIARLLAQLPGYFYSVSDEGIWVHLYGENQMEAALPGGEIIGLRQRTRYPWDGDVTLTVTEAPAGETSIFPRIPSWAKGATLTVGSETTFAQAGSYAEVRRVWAEGDEIKLSLPMPARVERSHRYVLENAGRVAVQRGPLVYCAEAVDHEGFDPRDVVLSGPLTPERREDLPGGATALRGSGTVEGREVPVTLVPYYAWANRGAGWMGVWFKE